MNTSNRQNIPAHAAQVKICGLTRVEEALLCVEAGAHAIGCVFYTGSPRSVTEDQARAISKALPEWIWTVGVFVNESFSGIMRRVERCGLKAVQLHGQEGPELVQRLTREAVQVIKVLFANGRPSIQSAPSYNVSAFLVECGGGALPGGNALEWNWKDASRLPDMFPLILAGGLTPDNVSQAIDHSCPDAVDVSSGVEAEPGRKDPKKVKRFLQAVFQSRCPRKPRRIFQ
jgi:phosphoribosylanthranilate isomerase